LVYNSKGQFAGKVFAESTETFNKWTQCYYQKPIPQENRT